MYGNPGYEHSYRTGMAELLGQRKKPWTGKRSLFSTACISVLIIASGLRASCHACVSSAFRLSPQAEALNAKPQTPNILKYKAF